MALDRQSIEKNDFPLGSHGYDPQAVDDHLKTLADEIAEFKSASRRRAENMASSASDQVRAIIEAAESSAAEIQRSAESEAQEIREEAHLEAHATRERAAADVQEHVDRVAEATGAMLARLESMEAELGNLLESVRTGAGRLDADVRELNAELGQAAEVVKPPAQVEFQPDPPPEPEPEPEPEPVAPAPPQAGGGWDTGGAGSEWAPSEPAVASEPPVHSWDAGPSEVHPRSDLAPADSGDAEGSGAPAQSWDAGASSPGWGAPEGEAASTDTSGDAGYDDWGQQPAGAAPSAPVEPGSESFPDASLTPPGESAPAPYGEPSHGSFDAYRSGADTGHDAGAGDEADDSEGARLIALNMALNGTPRDETARYLSENFQLSDRDGLLDEVYASVEG